eukprot:6488844-Amphidinium_carterae.3
MGQDETTCDRSFGQDEFAFACEGTLGRSFTARVGFHVVELEFVSRLGAVEHPLSSSHNS